MLKRSAALCSASIIHCRLRSLRAFVLSTSTWLQKLDRSGERRSCLLDEPSGNQWNDALGGAGVASGRPSAVSLVTCEGTLKIKSVRDSIGRQWFFAALALPALALGCAALSVSLMPRNTPEPQETSAAPSIEVDMLISGGAEEKNAEAQKRRLNIKAFDVATGAGTLSGGNQQKIVLAKWLSMQPRIIIFDEPTRGIDVGAKSEIYQLMRNLADSGVAVLMISSDMEEVIGVSDRMAVMHEGAISGFLERDRFSEHNVLQLAVGKHLN